MREQDYAVNHGQQVEQQEVSKVLRNTYGLLAITLAFSGVMAFIAQQMRVGYPNIFVVLIGFYGLFFLTNKLRDSAWGLCLPSPSPASWALSSALSSTVTWVWPVALKWSARPLP